MSERHWRLLEKGRLDLNAVDYLSKLKKKRICFIHGVKDKVVDVNRSKSLYKALNNPQNLLILLKGGHSNINIVLNDKKVFRKVMAWLDQA